MLRREAERRVNEAMYEAARKVGMESALFEMEVEVCISGGMAYAVWETEKLEIEGFEPNYEAFERAEKWLKAYVAKHPEVLR